MFCEKCGTEIKDGAEFCVSCGAPVPTPPETPEQPPANDAESKSDKSAEGDAKDKVDDEPMDADSIEDDDSEDEITEASWGDEPEEVEEAPDKEVSFLEGLEDPDPIVPRVEPTDDALLYEVKKFQALFHLYMKNCLNLLAWSRRRDALQYSGPRWYYENSNDELISNSRQITQAIDGAEASLKLARKGLQENAELQRKATSTRDEVRAKMQKIIDKATGDQRKRILRVGIVCLIIALVFVFPLFGALFNAGDNAFLYVISFVLAVALMAGVGYLAVIQMFRNNTKKRRKAEEEIRAAEAAFAQSINELAQKNAELTKQARSIEQQLLRVYPVAGEIRHYANLQAEYLYNVEMLKIQNTMEEFSRIITDEYLTLKASKVIRIEDDWVEIDRIVKIVESGRGESIKEMLHQLDTAVYRESDLNAKNSIASAQHSIAESQRIMNKVLAAGFTGLIAETRRSAEQVSRSIDGVRGAIDRQTIANVVMKAQEISVMSKQLGEDIKQTSIAQKQLDVDIQDYTKRWHEAPVL